MSAKDKKSDTNAPSVANKKARRLYELMEKYEAGISLKGSEVKSLRNAQADLTGSYARIENGQAWLMGANISPYKQAGVFNHDPKRDRKLLLHKAELRKIKSKLEQRGFTLVPLKIYFNKRGIAKVQLALAKGKKQYDKRKQMTDKRVKKELDQTMKKYR